MDARISASHAQIQEMIQHATQDANLEVCGLVCGKEGRVHEIIPIRNIAAYPDKEFVMDPQQLFTNLKKLDQQKYDILAIYHSHPQGEAIPSSEDICHARLNYPNMPQIIIGLRSSLPSLRVWIITEDRIEAAESQIGKEILFVFPPEHPGKQENLLFAAALFLGATLLVIASILLLPPAPILNIP